MWPFGKKAKQPIMKPKEPGPTEKRPEPPKDIKWECPTCKKAFPERTTRSRFKCPHCRNWVCFLGKNLVTLDERARHWEEEKRQREEEDRVWAKENIKQLHKDMKEQIKEYAKEEFTAGVEIICSDDSCEVCKRIAGQYTFKQGIPLVPIEGCTHERGCQCIFSSYIEEL